MNVATSVLRIGFAKYSNSLISNPYRTKMTTAGVIFGTADAVCQKFFENEPGKSFDYGRTLNMVLIGSFMSAPINHLWYCKWASQMVDKVTRSNKLKPFVSTAADQILLTPITLSSFLFLNDYLKDFRSLKAARNVRGKLWEGLKANWKVWPPIVLANFLIVPPPMRVLFVNAFGFFWTIYLSHLQNKK